MLTPFNRHDGVDSSHQGGSKRVLVIFLSGVAMLLRNFEDNALHAVGIDATCPTN